jgi:hypothetical protein
MPGCICIWQWQRLLTRDRQCTIHTCKTVNTAKSLLTTDRPILSSEKTTHNGKSVTVKTETDIWSWAPNESQHQDGLTHSLTDSLTDNDWLIHSFAHPLNDSPIHWLNHSHYLWLTHWPSVVTCHWLWHETLSVSFAWQDCRKRRNVQPSLFYGCPWKVEWARGLVQKRYILYQAIVNTGFRSYFT